MTTSMHSLLNLIKLPYLHWQITIFAGALTHLEAAFNTGIWIRPLTSRSQEASIIVLT